MKTSKKKQFAMEENSRKIYFVSIVSSLLYHQHHAFKFLFCCVFHSLSPPISTLLWQSAAPVGSMVCEDKLLRRIEGNTQGDFL